MIGQSKTSERQRSLNATCSERMKEAEVIKSKAATSAISKVRIFKTINQPYSFEFYLLKSKPSLDELKTSQLY